jgi:hypothetical protein
MSVAGYAVFTGFGLECIITPELHIGIAQSSFPVLALSVKMVMRLVISGETDGFTLRTGKKGVKPVQDNNMVNSLGSRNG